MTHYKAVLLSLYTTVDVSRLFGFEIPLLGEMKKRVLVMAFPTALAISGCGSMGGSEG